LTPVRTLCGSLSSARTPHLDIEPLHNERYPLRLGEGVFVRNRFSEDIFKKAAKAFATSAIAWMNLG